MLEAFREIAARAGIEGADTLDFESIYGGVTAKRDS
jgi:hypothetical protein